MSKKTENAKQRHVPYKAFKLAMAGKGLTLRDVAAAIEVTEDDPPRRRSTAPPTSTCRKSERSAKPSTST